MSKVGSSSPALQSLKAQYLEAKDNNDKPKMNKLKQKAMAEMQKIKSKESNDSIITNEDGDFLDISDEGLDAQKKSNEKNEITDNE